MWKDREGSSDKRKDMEDNAAPTEIVRPVLYTVESNLLRLRDEEILRPDDSVSSLLDCKTCQ